MSYADFLEALLFAADRPVPLERLARAAQISLDEAAQALQDLTTEKSLVGALSIIEVAGGFQMVTKAAFAPTIRRLRDEKKARLSRAAFEVLAIIAYRQPVTRGEVDMLRGVESGGPVHLLLERKLIAPAGRRKSAGKPWLFKTTPLFLEQFGLASLDDLPTLEEFSALKEIDKEPQTLELFPRGDAREDSAVL